jgi:hypothetical protein
MTRTVDAENADAAVRIALREVCAPPVKLATDVQVYEIVVSLAGELCSACGQRLPIGQEATF